MSTSLVLVTGASGFIATHVIQQLQRAGYRVRGTVRSLQNQTKVAPLYKLCPSAEHHLELVEADLSNAKSWNSAVEGCDYVLHVASPFPPSQPKHEDDLIKPAVEGTTNVLQACKNTPSVKRVVITSSTAAISIGHDEKTCFSEEDWSVTEKCDAYSKSKTLAEKAAWDFIKVDDVNFELAVVNPGMVLGPLLNDSVGTSNQIVTRLLKREVPLLPNVGFGFIDVRDVAAAEIAAMTKPEAVGHRHILTSRFVWFKEISDILVTEFDKQGYSVPTHVAPGCFVKFLALFDKGVGLIVHRLGVKDEFDNTRMRTVLGIEPHSVESSTIDTGYSCIEHGLVKKTSKYKGAPEHLRADCGLES